MVCKPEPNHSNDHLKHMANPVCEVLLTKFPLKLIIIHHRIGFIGVGQSSLFVRVTSQHRAEAFRASQWVIDELKKKVPIWKRPRLKMEDDMRPGSAHSATVAILTT